MEIVTSTDTGRISGDTEDLSRTLRHSITWSWGIQLGNCGGARRAGSQGRRAGHTHPAALSST